MLEAGDGLVDRDENRIPAAVDLVEDVGLIELNTETLVDHLAELLDVRVDTAASVVLIGGASVSGDLGLCPLTRSGERHLVDHGIVEGLSLVTEDAVASATVLGRLELRQEREDLLNASEPGRLTVSDQQVARAAQVDA